MPAQRPGTIEFKWADGEHAFRLGIGQLRELQDKTGCGPMELLNRLTQGKWRVDDLRETIRIALIGGGKKPPEALTLVQRYVDERPLAESILPAQAILMACVFGEAPEGQNAGEPERRGNESGQTDGFPSPVSTARVQ